ncbi:hypothetical protein V1294_005449 [Bradyrhizobium sp. AZCC 1678]|uniref:hypothetical protein n=1 Tax=Bradyrhizobium sp. AZCC 1678 TaxID=3117030 RepID=UPI002FF28696
MTVSAEKIAELRVKNLEMLQSLISRMAGYGASFKSYCITVTTGVIGFGLTLHSPAVAALALLPVLAFAAADAQYLRVERRFRALFDIVRKQKWDEMPPFDISLETAPPQSFLSAAISWSIVWFYAPLAIVVLLAVLGVRVYG